MQNPLEYFLDFIESNHVYKLKEKFFSNVYKYSKEEEWVEDLVNMEGDEKLCRLFFKEYINTHFSEKVSQAKKSIENLLFNESKKNSKKEVLKYLLEQTISLEAKYTLDENVNQYNLSSQITGIKNYVTEKLSEISDGVQVHNIHNDFKLKWKGTSAELISLFRALMFEGIEGKPLIEEVSPGEMKKFLQANFLTKDGHNIESSTFDKNWASCNSVRRKSFNSGKLDDLINNDNLSN